MFQEGHFKTLVNTTVPVAYATDSDTAGRDTADDVIAAAALKVALNDYVPDCERRR
jgi:hypothetical protein